MAPLWRMNIASRARRCPQASTALRTLGWRSTGRTPRGATPNQFQAAGFGLASLYTEGVPLTVGVRNSREWALARPLRMGVPRG